METLITYLIETILWNRPLIVMMIFHIFFYGVGISVFSGGSQFLVIGHKCIFCPSQLRANSGIPRLLVNLLACGTLSRLIFNIFLSIWHFDGNLAALIKSRHSNRTNGFKLTKLSCNFFLLHFDLRNQSRMRDLFKDIRLKFKFL